MAQYSLRLRRALSLSSSLLQHHQLSSARPFSPLRLISHSTLSSAQITQNPSFCLNSELQLFKSFKSSALTYRNQRSGPVDDQEIGPDTILFEGCDYNHWLITMDLPKEYTPEQKVEAYVRAATQVFGSEEEAKKRIYACSTSVYIGFQVECSEETSEKFKDVEGVVFVLPDSYIDPVNKEYGGDKYVNGTIIPRPPPIQYGRREGRSGDRRPRGQPYQNRGPMQGDSRNFGPPQNPPSQQKYGPVGGPPPQQNYGHGYGQQQNSSPGHNYGQPQNLPPQHQPSFTGQQNYGPQGSNFPPYQNYGPTGAVSPGGWNDYQGDRRDFQQGDQRVYTSPEPRSFAGQGQSCTSPQDASFNQGPGAARHEMNPGYGQRYTRNTEEQRFSQGGYGNNIQGAEQRHYTASGEADQPSY